MAIPATNIMLEIIMMPGFIPKESNTKPSSANIKANLNTNYTKPFHKVSGQWRKDHTHNAQ